MTERNFNVPSGWRLDLSVPSEMLGELESVLDEQGISFTILALPDESLQLNCYLPSEQAASDLQERVRGFPLITSELAPIKDLCWREKWLEDFRPTEIGENLLVVPEWERAPEVSERKVLKIHPHATFGAGTHPTTQLVIQLLERELRGYDTSLTSCSVLDLGCGSGIVGIAGMILGATRGLGLDIDLEAVTVARENAKLNGVTDIEFSNRLIETVVEQFDIAVANMITSELRGVWGDLVRLVRPGGCIILSGILHDEAEEFISTLNCKVTDRVVNGEWIGVRCLPVAKEV